MKKKKLNLNYKLVQLGHSQKFIRMYPKKILNNRKVQVVLVATVPLN